MKKQDLVFLAVILAIGGGMLFQEEIKGVLSLTRELFLAKVAEPLVSEELEQLKITLPETPLKEPLQEDEIEEVEPSPGLEQEPQKTGEATALSEKEEPSLTLPEIQEKVDEISEKVEIVSEQVAQLVKVSEQEAAAQKTREARLADIQQQINDISQQIEIISRQVVQLAETSAQGV